MTITSTLPEAEDVATEIYDRLRDAGQSRNDFVWQMAMMHRGNDFNDADRCGHMVAVSIFAWLQWGAEREMDEMTALAEGCPFDPDEFFETYCDHMKDRYGIPAKEED